MEGLKETIIFIIAVSCNPFKWSNARNILIFPNISITVSLENLVAHQEISTSQVLHRLRYRS